MIVCCETLQTSAASPVVKTALVASSEDAGSMLMSVVHESRAA
jgi:hypothetical protein